VRIEIRIAATRFDGERNFFADQTERLAALRIRSGFGVFNGLPFAMSGHNLNFPLLQRI
jgi:hypothetical protein